MQEYFFRCDREVRERFMTPLSKLFFEKGDSTPFFITQVQVSPSLYSRIGRNVRAKVDLKILDNLSKYGIITEIEKLKSST